MSKASRRSQVQVFGAELAASMGYELLEAAFEKESSGIYLRFYLDSPQGISLKDCEAYHRRIQPMLDKVEYDYLEVCSPGIDRPIKTAADAQKAFGSQVEVKLYKPLEGTKLFVGELLGLDEAGYHLNMGGREMVFEARNVALARRVIDIDQALAQQPAEEEGES